MQRLWLHTVFCPFIYYISPFGPLTPTNGALVACPQHGTGHVSILSPPLGLCTGPACPQSPMAEIGWKTHEQGRKRALCGICAGLGAPTDVLLHLTTGSLSQHRQSQPCKGDATGSPRPSSMPFSQKQKGRTPSQLRKRSSRTAQASPTRWDNFSAQHCRMLWLSASPPWRKMVHVISDHASGQNNKKDQF